MPIMIYYIGTDFTSGAFVESKTVISQNLLLFHGITVSQQITSYRLAGKTFASNKFQLLILDCKSQIKQFHIH